MCDSKTLLNRHLACGTTFDRSIVNLNFELDDDKEKLCRYGIAAKCRFVILFFIWIGDLNVSTQFANRIQALRYAINQERRLLHEQKSDFPDTAFLKGRGWGVPCILQNYCLKT